jgi:hypothetical protein
MCFWVFEFANQRDLPVISILYFDYICRAQTYFSGFKHFTTEKKHISNPKGGNISRILANPQSTGAGASLLIPMLWKFPTGLYDRASAEDYLK